MREQVKEEIQGLYNQARNMPLLCDGSVKLSEYGNIILAGNKANDSDFEFYIWKKIGDKLVQEFYTDDFLNAKKEFLNRSGLLMNLSPFDEYEYNLLHSSINHALKTSFIDNEKIESLERLNDKILDLVKEKIVTEDIMLDESVILLIKKGLDKTDASSIADDITKDGLEQIVEIIEALEHRMFGEYIHNVEEQTNSKLRFDSGI